ncbi:MAG TPA: HAD family hydrolase [Solirubrobacterales bacterium]|nr:HAD family hydrolase [Solirubrobacterales bacterium]
MSADGASPIPGPPAAISFDFWNTLVAEPGGKMAALRREAVIRVLLEHEVELEEGVLDAHLAAAQALQDAAWKRTEAFSPAQAARHVADSIEGLGAGGKELIEEAMMNAGAAAEVQLTPNVPETVAALAAGGIQLGIVCDVGLTGSPHLRGFLDAAGVLRHFRGWAFSDEVGHFKPSPEIFRHMLGQFELGEAAVVWHVGDLRRTDVAGARGSGIVPIRYRGMDDDDSDAAEADLVIDDLADLVPLALG